MALFRPHDVERLGRRGEAEGPGPVRGGIGEHGPRLPREPERHVHLVREQQQIVLQYEGECRGGLLVIPGPPYRVVRLAENPGPGTGCGGSVERCEVVTPAGRVPQQGHGHRPHAGLFDHREQVAVHRCLHDDGGAGRQLVPQECPEPGQYVRRAAKPRCGGVVLTGQMACAGLLLLAGEAVSRLAVPHGAFEGAAEELRCLQIHFRDTEADPVRFRRAHLPLQGAPAAQDVRVRYEPRGVRMRLGGPSERGVRARGVLVSPHRGPARHRGGCRPSPWCGGAR